jgi:hypothetical protein
VEPVAHPAEVRPPAGAAHVGEAPLDFLVARGRVDLRREGAREDDEPLPLEVDAVGLVRAAERTVEHEPGSRPGSDRVDGAA